MIARGQSTDKKSRVHPADLAGDQIQAGHPLNGVIWINPDRMSGTPCFFGTRIPVSALYDYLRIGHNIDEFTTDFPGVTRQQIEAILSRASEAVTSLGGKAA